MFGSIKEIQEILPAISEPPSSSGGFHAKVTPSLEISSAVSGPVGMPGGPGIFSEQR